MPREKLRNNPLNSRFELFDDGVMIAYLKYDLRAGHITLLETVVGTDYRGRGLESVLIRHCLLDAHQRRLKTIPYCPHAQAFLAANPHFTSFVPTS